MQQRCSGPRALGRRTSGGIVRPRLLKPTAAVATQVRAAPVVDVKLDSVPRGETAGAMLVLEEGTLGVADRDLLIDAEWKLMPGQRVGIVGANGAGKSTLLKCVTGHRQLDGGRLLISHKAELGYLEQTAVSGSQLTVWEEARSRMVNLLAAEQQLAAAEEAMNQGDPNATEMLKNALARWEAVGGPTAEKRVTNVLGGLGFRADQFHRPCSEFSGGWQMRIALARLLLGPAGEAASSGTPGGLLVLDEPTNHLDSKAIAWLASFLKSSSGTVIIVSHDEKLLETACERIVEVRGKKLHHYVGSYNTFLRVRAEREAQALATAAAQQAEIERLQGFVDRFGAKASKASAAQSRVKMIEKLRAGAVEAPAAASADGGGDAKKVTLRLPRAPACHQEVLVMKNGSVGWGPAFDSTASSDASSSGSDSESIAREPLLKDLNFTVKRGQRILVLGPNGAGKSTLLKAVAGQIPLWSGSLKQGEGVRLSVFAQDLAQELPLEMGALEYVEMVARKENPGITMEKCRQALGALGLQGSLGLQKIGLMSGGEKARAALAAFALVPCNVLLLDEASNHLDAATIKVLTQALQEFEGAIVAITHNQAFAESLSATHILRVGGGTARITDNLGLSAADFEHDDDHSSGGSSKVSKGGKGKGKKGGKAAAEEPAVAAPVAAPSTSSSASSSSAASSSGGKAKRTTLSWKEQEEYGKLKANLPKLMKKRDELQNKVSQLASSGAAFKTLEAASKELALLVDDVEAKEWRWMELAEIAGDI